MNCFPCPASSTAVRSAGWNWCSTATGAKCNSRRLPAKRRLIDRLVNVVVDETDDAGLAARLDRIKTLIDDLARVQQDSQAARELVLRIQRETDAALKTFDTHPPPKSS